MKLSLTVILLLISVVVFSQEICNNGIDDDGDGLIDLNDTEDCYCDSVITNEVPSLIPNPSFEDYTCCPDDYSYLSCANTWIQASQATSDYFNTCDFTGIAPLPFPDGNAAAGVICCDSYSEYIGACLNSSMQAGVAYQIEFDLAFDVMTDLGEHSPTFPASLPPIEFTIFGTNTCSDLPFNSISCPDGLGNWHVLGTVTVDPNDIHASWDNFSITVTPSSNIRAIALGGPCSYSAGGEYNAGCLNPAEGQQFPYFFVDNLVLNESSFWGLQINVEGDYCTNDLVLDVTTNAIETVQWYLDGVAIDGEFLNNLEISENGYPMGNYTVVISDINNCATGTVSIVSPEIDIDPIEDMVSCTEIYLPQITGINLTGNQNYYTQPGGNGDIVTNPVTVAQMVYAYDEIGICHDQEGFYVNPNNSPNVFDLDDQNSCGSYNLPNITGENLTGNQNYFTEPFGTGEIVNSPVTTSQQIYIFDGSTECSDEESFVVTIYDTPDIITDSTIFGCNSIDLPTIEGAFLTGSENYYTSPNGQGSIVSSPITHSQIIYAFDENTFCSDNEEISITIYQDLPTFAGDNIYTCSNTISLEAVPSISGSNGYWVGPGNIQDPSNPITQVTHNFGAYTFYWYESYETCNGVDSTVVSFVESPAPYITNSFDTVCANIYSIHVENSNYPGFWTAYIAEDTTLLSPAPLYLPSISSSDVNVTIGNFDGSILDVIFIWTEGNQVQGNICNTEASTTISFTKQPYASIGAINEAEICGMEFLGLNADITGCEWAETEWISPNTSCLFGNCTQAQTSATLLNEGVFGDSAFVRLPFLWTVQNYTCSDVDTMWVNFYQEPEAFAGLDDAICGNYYELGAIFDIPESNNYTPSGSWSTSYDNIDIESFENDSCDATVHEYGIFEFVFREYNTLLSACTSVDTVQIEFLEIPIIDAGENRDICGNCTELEAIGADFTGSWIQTPGVIFNDYNNPTTGVCAANGIGEITFTWLESNLATTSTLSCTSTDNVTIHFWPQPSAQILTDENNTTACGLTFNNLRAENEGEGITGYWYTTSPGVEFGDEFSNDTYTTVSSYACHDFYWIEESGSSLEAGFCTDTSNLLNLCFYEIPHTDAGADITFCDSCGNLAAIPSIGVGVWNIPSIETITFEDVNNSQSEICTEITEQTIELIWTEDNNGCTDTDEVLVSFSQSPSSSINVVPPKCFGECAIITANDDTLIQYAWNFGSGTILSYEENEHGGKYLYRVLWNNDETEHLVNLISTNNYNCQSPINIDTIVEPEIPEFEYELIGDTCNLGKGAIFISENSDENAFFWLTQDIGPNIDTPVDTIYNLPAGIYNLQRSYQSPNIDYYHIYLTEFGTSNCLDTIELEIETTSMLDAEFEVSAEIDINNLVAPNANVVLINNSFYDNAPRRCEWHFGDNIEQISCDDFIEHNYEFAGCFTPYLVIMNRDIPECRDTAFLETCIAIDNASSIEVPNIFSPNNDGINDYFQVKAQTINSFSGQIINRWGNIVYSWENWENYEAGWNGNLKGGTKAASGVYFYIIQAKGIDNIEYNLEGSLHLMSD